MKASKSYFYELKTWELRLKVNMTEYCHFPEHNHDGQKIVKMQRNLYFA